MADPVTPAVPAAATVDLGRVHGLVRAARTRLRLQGALEGAATSSILASASALGVVFLVRTEVLPEPTGVALLAASAGVVGLGALLGALGRHDDEAVARRIDRASGLADRLSSAVAFARTPPAADADADTVALMEAAMRDAAAVAPRANVKAATPLAAPRDLKPALGFAAIAALAAAFGVATPPRDPHLLGARPAAAPRGAIVTIDGERLCGPKAPPERTCALPSALVYVGDGGAAVAAPIEAWTGGGITLAIPAGAKLGATELVVWARGKRLGAVPFEVTADDDPRNFAPDTVALDPDDEAYLRDLVADVRATAKKDEVKALEDYAAKVEALLDLADQGKLTKEQLLAELQKAQAELEAGADPNPEQIAKDLAETGKELANDPLTKEVGEALAKGDLAQAKAELEKLAEKLEQGALDPKQAEKLAQALEQAAEKYQAKQDAKAKQDQAQTEKLEEQVRKLEKEKDDAKTEEERADAERRLEKKKDELERLEKNRQEREQSTQREALERLHKQMKQSAEDLQKKPESGDPKDQQSQKDQQEKNQQQASRSLRDVADETGKVDQDQRKQAAQKKMASQMDDLREAMRRAKQRGKQGSNSPFGKNNQKNQDFARRAAGGQGQKGAWKPGQGQGQKGQGQGQGQGQPGQGQQGQGQGQGQNGGQGDQPNGPSDTYGDGHDPNLVGDATPTSGNTTDESVSGVHGRKGPSKRETILAAAQKGYASTAYREVYAKYKDIVEDAMKSEKVPASYKYYVKKYFTKIKPHAMN
jgi:hypothetical protein